MRRPDIAERFGLGTFGVGVRPSGSGCAASGQRSGRCVTPLGLRMTLGDVKGYNPTLAARQSSVSLPMLPRHGVQAPKPINSKRGLYLASTSKFWGLKPSRQSLPVVRPHRSNFSVRTELWNQPEFFHGLPIVSIVVPFSWFNQFYINDPTR